MSLRSKFDKSAKLPFPRTKPKLALYGMMLVLLIPNIAGCGMLSSHQNITSIVQAKETTFPAYQFAPGDRIVYKLEYTNTSASDFRVLFKDQNANTTENATPLSLVHSFQTTVQGELIATVLDKKADSVLISYSLRQPVVRLNADGQEAVTQAQTIKTDLGQEIFASVSPQGRVLWVRFDPAADNLSQSFARTLLAATQFVVPGAQTSDQSQWETQEDDPNGQYIARYQVTGDSQAALRTFQKTKVRYLQPPRQNTKPGEFQVPTTTNPEGNLVARFDVSKGHLVSLNGKESQVINIAGKTVARTENTLQISYLSKETLSQTELSKLQDASAAREKVAAAVPLSVNPSKEALETVKQRNELGNATLESLLADLKQAEASPDKNNDTTPLYLKFKALVYLHPETSASLGKILATAEPKSLTMRILAGALSAVGHSEAQTALATAIQARPKNWPALSTLIPTLSEASSPTQLAEDTLRDLAFNSTDRKIATTAQLALGTMARNFAEASPERAAKIVDRMIKEIQSSSSNDVTKQLLLVLGNAGSVRALPTITQFTTNPSPEVRAAAVSALRWLNSSQVDVLLTKALSSDPEETVRLEAAAALSFREMNAATFAAQKRAFVTDKAVNVRLTVLKNLWQAHEAFPEVRQIVKQAAEKDASKDIREAAANIIAVSPKGYFD